MCGPGITYFKWMEQPRIKGMNIHIRTLKVVFLSVISIHADIREELQNNTYVFSFLQLRWKQR